MAAPTAQEQYILELVNRARLNPLAEAQRYGIDLNQGLAAGTLTATQKQPLAINFLLNGSADGHSIWMLATDIFSHTGISNTSPMQRMQAAGYVFTGNWWNGENIAYTGTTGTLDFNAAMSSLHQNLFLSAGHRENILNDGYREFGAGAQSGVFTSGGTDYNTAMLTENFATTGSNHFVTGVVFNDTDANKFYSIGEGRGGVTTTLKAGATVLASSATWAAGGYTMATGATGAMSLQFSGGGLAQPVGVAFTDGTENVKFDLINSTTIASTVSATLLGGALNLNLLGINSINGTGNALANTIVGNSGNNTLLGEGGSDVVLGGLGNDFLRGGAAADKLDGGAGIDLASYGNSTAGVSINLYAGTGTGGDAAGDTLVGMENLQGSAFNDVLFGNALANTLLGNAGNDALLGGAGADRLDGGDGALDRVTYGNAASGVIVNLLTGKGTLGDALGDTLVSIEWLTGSNFADQLTGNGLANVLNGIGGNDILSGGAGADRFDFTGTAFGADRITDFTDNVDKLCFYSGSAASFANFTIAHNGTTDVTVTCASGSIVVHGAAAITLTAGDFLFF